MIRVFQLDGDPSFLAAMKEHCSRLADLHYEGSAEVSDLRSALGGDKPDLILLDLDIAPRGGVWILKAIRAKFTSQEVKVVVISSAMASEEELMDTSRLGADYFMERPVDIIVLETRIRQLMNEPENPLPEPVTHRAVQEICTKYFEQMGVPPHFKGYRYLMDGIWLASLNPVWLGAITQNLYPAIAQRFEVSAAQVERAMRYALDVTWEKGNVEELYELFPYVRENKGKPTNSAFISKMVDLVAFAINQSV